MSNIIKTSQIIIPASKKEIYIKTDSDGVDISFFGWTLKTWNSVWKAAVEEVLNETWLILWQEQLYFLENKTKELEKWTYQTTFYTTPIFNGLHWEWIQRASIDDLEIIKATFTPERIDFLRQVRLALNYEPWKYKS